jgi:hypothetical protein
MFVYNSVGNIDENALQTLGLVVNMAKNIQQQKSITEGLDENTIAETFPFFLWIVRDFSLQLVDENNFKISSRLYFEKALEQIKGHSTKTEAKNKVRKLIKHFFRNRDCVTMIRPVENEKDLQKLNELPDYRLRSDFLKQIQTTRSMILRRITAKKMNGQYIDGPRLIALAEAYIDSVNNGGAPCIENAWEFVRKFENKKTTEKTIGMIRDVIKIKNGEQSLGINLDMKQMFLNNPQVRQPKKIQKEIELISNQILGKEEDYLEIKPFLLQVYKENLLGEVRDNEDLIQEFEEKLDKKMKIYFKSLEGEVEKTAEKELRERVEKEAQELLGNKELVLEECDSKYKQVWNDIEEKYGKYFDDENGLKEKIMGLFEREKAKTFGLLLREVQNRKELEDQKRSKNEKMRKFKEEEAKKRIEEEMEEYKTSLSDIKRKNAERLVAFRKKEKEYEETCEKVKDLEHENEKLKERISNQKESKSKIEEVNGELKRELEEKRMMLEEEQKRRMREEAMSSQKEVLMENKTRELREEIENLKTELKGERRKIKENEKKMKLMKKEQEREDRVVMDSDQLKLLQDKLEEYVDRLESMGREKDALNMELREKETENDLLRGRVEIMENNFKEIEKNNQKFLNEITSRVKNIQEKQPKKLSENLTLNLEKFALWKKILKICNLFQCGKCSKFIPKKMILIHINSCLSSKELQILGLSECSHNSLDDLGIEGKSLQPQTSLRTQPLKISSNLSIKMVQSLVREQEVEGESRPYTEYIFRLYNDSMDIEWHVSRKFKEFCQLLVDLQNQNLDIQLPDSCFELWTYVNDIWGLIGNSAVNLDKRLELLQKMMNDLVKSREIRHLTVFQEFICFGEPKEDIWN